MRAKQLLTIFVITPLDATEEAFLNLPKELGDYMSVYGDIGVSAHWAGIFFYTTLF